MNRTNLIPRDRLRRRAVRGAAVRWAVAVPAVTATAVATCWALSLAWPGSTAVAAEADRASAAAVVAEARAATVAVRVSTARQTRDAARSVADQPDWGLLLANLSRQLGDDGVLSACQLTTAGGAVTVRLTGVARSQPGVTQLALRLERAGPFDRVELLQTTAAELLGGPAVAFQIVCTAGTPPPTVAVAGTPWGRVP